MTFVRDPSLLRRLSGMRGFGDASSPYTNPDGSPTYDSQPYDVYDTSNPFNYDNQITDANSLAAAGFVSPTVIPPPTFSLPSIFTGPLPVTTPPPLVNYTPGGNAGTAISASGLPANTLTPAPAAPSIAGLTSIFSSISSILTGKPVTALSPSGGVVVPKPATAPAALSGTTMLLLAGLGVAALLFVNSSRRR